MPFDTDNIVREVRDAFSSNRSIEPFTDRLPGFAVDDAYAVTAGLRAGRIADGETPVGRKIGFTNRGIWDQYGVRQPIWGDIYSSNLIDASGGKAVVRVGGFFEPRIEPEVVVGFDADVGPDDDVDAIAAKVAWVAHGIEVVQSVYPGWKFQAADCIAAGGMHAALVVGRRRELSPAERRAFCARLPSLSLELLKGSEVCDRGTGADALDGPLHAVKHLCAVLAADTLNPSIRAGELVTTGTMTGAYLVYPGERWSTKVDFDGLSGIELEIA